MSCNLHLTSPRTSVIKSFIVHTNVQKEYIGTPYIQIDIKNCAMRLLISQPKERAANTHTM